MPAGALNHHGHSLTQAVQQRLHREHSINRNEMAALSAALQVGTMREAQVRGCVRRAPQHTTALDVAAFCIDGPDSSVGFWRRLCLMPLC